MWWLDTETALIVLGYWGVFFLMISNGFITLPSSQVLYIVAGYFAGLGQFNLWIVALVGAIGNTIGNIILYELSRRKGMHYILKLKVFPEEQIKKIQILFQSKGAWFVFVGKLLPAIKVFVPIPAGIGKMSRLLFATLMFLSSYLWALIFLAIGFFFGKSSNFFGKYSLILLVVAFIVAILFKKQLDKIELDTKN